LFYTFFFADVVTGIDFKKDKYNLVANVSRVRLSSLIRLLAVLCKSLSFDIHILPAGFMLFLRVIKRGADLPRQIGDLLFHRFFVFIGSWRITAPFALYNV